MPRTGKAPTSNKVRCYNWTWFKALQVNEKFYFGSDVDGWGTTGLAVKTSARKYTYKDKDGKDVENAVGSIKAIVVKVDGEDRPHKLQDYVPYLGD